MLGLADFMRAVRGSAGLTLRRAPSLTGLALLVVLWLVALGTFFWLSSDDTGSVDDASPRTAREAAGARSPGSDGDDDGGARSVPGAAESDDGGVLDPATTSTSAPDEALAPQERAPDGTGDPGAATPPPTNRPDWNESVPRPTTTTTSPGPGSTAPTTTTTAPPDEGGGGLIGGLLDLLGLGD